MGNEEQSGEGKVPGQESGTFDDLLALIDEELRAQIAIGRLGEIDPPAPAVHSVALLSLTS